MKTKILFFDNAELIENAATILDSGSDEAGNYIIVDESCYFPGGGGQAQDTGIIIADGKEFKITSGDFKEGCLKLYLDTAMDFAPQTKILIKIDASVRKVNSILHSAGHLLSSVIFEEMKLDLSPVKGYHYADGSHVEFASVSGLKSVDADEINRLLDLKIAEEIPIYSQLVRTDSLDYENSFRISGFLPSENAAIRLVKIGGFLAYACGGTHVLHTGCLKGLKVTGCKSKKGNLRVKYHII